MSKKVCIRERGTGTIEKKHNHFYLKLRIGNVAKKTLLRGSDDKPVTTRKDAEKAADLLRPVLRATQKEEIAFHVANARKLVKQSNFPIEKIWNTFLKQSSRPDSGEGTLAGYQKKWKLFFEWLKKEHPEVKQASQITSDIASEYFNEIWEDQVSASTFNSRKQALGLIFTHTQHLMGMEDNPFAHIRRKVSNAESREAFTPEQVKQIFDGFQTGFFYETEIEGLGPGRKRIRRKVTQEYVPMNKDEMYVLLNLCCWTGCRGEDGCMMQWNNIDLNNKTITYIPMKTAKKTGYKSVTLPLHPQLFAALKKAKSWCSHNRNGEEYIIPNVAHRFQYNCSGVQKDVMKIIRCATGLKTTAETKKTHRKIRANRYSLHSFRHTFVSFCANAGVPLAVVASIVGHTSTAMTQHYTHISDEAKSQAIQALPILFEKPVEKDPKDELLQKLSEMSAEELTELLNGKNKSSDESVEAVKESHVEYEEQPLEFVF